MLKVSLNIVDIQCLIENSWILILCRGNFVTCFPGGSLGTAMQPSWQDIKSI